MEKEYLFVYGTLLSSLNSPAGSVLKMYAKRISPATIQGRLYDIGGYPGLVLADDGAEEGEIIYGELYMIREKENLLSALDEYEGCSPRFPEPREYVRKVIPVTTPERKQVQAWAYLYNWELSGRLQIESGDYKKFVRSIGRG
ncbi:MAG: gamma-glutamylcyclotransferase [Balneolaceae bacterium]|nr:gamma-glutamylcyclotransferase [Balneolaceae bacterium]